MLLGVCGADAIAGASVGGLEALTHPRATELHGVDEVPRGGPTRYSAAMDVEEPLQRH
jgi:hypothetical protein